MRSGGEWRCLVESVGNFVNTTAGAPRARPTERSGAKGPRERRRWGAGGAKPPDLVWTHEPN